MSKSTHLDNFGIVPNNNTSRKNVINHTVAEDLSSKQHVMLTPIKHEDIDAALFHDANVYGSHQGLTTVDETAALIPPNLRVDSRKDSHLSVAHSNRNSHVSSKHMPGLVTHPAEKYKDRSPRHEIRLPHEMEKNLMAAQGKLAYVSPTVRQNNTHRHTYHGSTSLSQKLPSSGNLNFVTPHNGTTSSQLSPAHPGMQVGQPAVLLNTGSQVDIHR